MKNVVLMVLIGAIGVVCSCKQQQTDETNQEQALAIFSEALVTADLNYQVDDKGFYEREFMAVSKISEDSLIRYAKFFSELVDANFYFDGTTSVPELKEMKQDYDAYKVKFRERGFGDFCQAFAGWNDLFGKSEADYANWLRQYNCSREEFEKDIVDISIRFGRLCKIKSEKENRDSARK